MEHRISVVTSDDQERMIATLTAAFLIDPFMRWMLPDPQQYLGAFPPMLRALGRASNPINLALFERHGFCSVGCVRVGYVPA